MYPVMLFEVVFELEGFVAIVALVLPQVGALVVADHVPLQSVHIREALMTDLACLSAKEKTSLLKLGKYLFEL